MLALLPLITLIACTFALPTPQNGPSNAIVTPHRARNGFLMGSSTTLPKKRDHNSAIIYIQVPPHTSMLFNPKEEGTPQVGPASIGVQINKGDSADYEWRIKEKAIKTDGEDVDVWSLQCNLTFDGSVSSNPIYAFILSALEPFVSGDLYKDAVFKCGEAKCLEDNKCQGQPKPSFDTRLSRLIGELKF
ncbi:hypothetical protein L204_102224 [Cryptococcus depauperatus]|nr:hypothetical protein L204_04722 [Cryptococcus depauperatus CBS 7855]